MYQHENIHIYTCVSEREEHENTQVQCETSSDT